MTRYGALIAFAALLLSVCDQARAEAPALPACAPQKIEVYFNFGAADVTPEAVQVIHNVVSTLQTCSAQSIKVRGHMDSAEARHSPGVSQTRADAVQGYLAQRGVSAALITAEDLKFTHPAVETAPGVREPENRNVDISINGG